VISEFTVYIIERRRKVKIILVSHGPFSKGLLESVQMILGEQKDIVAYGLFPHETTEDLLMKIEAELTQNQEEEYLFLSDLYCGSPFNAVLRLMEKYDVYHVTGISLPLLLEAVLARNSGATAAEVSDKIVEISKDSVKDIKKLLEKGVI
jgi:mannose PTS system EIIA component